MRAEEDTEDCPVAEECPIEKESGTYRELGLERADALRWKLSGAQMSSI